MTVGVGYFAISDQITSTDTSLMVICHSWDNTILGSNCFLPHHRTDKM